MGKYKQDAQLLLEYVGGKENIAAVSHCVSRMRFVLNDPAKADVAKIEALKSAKGTFTQAGQFQVIIGNTVSDFYNDFIAVSGIDGVSKDAVKSAAKQNQNALQKVMSVLAEIFAPLIPAIITGGLILGFRNCIDSIYLFNNGTQTLCDISQFWSGVDSFLWLIGEAIFHMLPVCICWSVTKKMGTTESLGIVLGLTLVSGQMLNAYSVASTAAADIPKWDFGFFTVNMIGYQAQVIPAMLAAFTLVYLEKFFWYFPLSSHTRFSDPSAGRSVPLFPTLSTLASPVLSAWSSGQSSALSMPRWLSQACIICPTPLICS